MLLHQAGDEETILVQEIAQTMEFPLIQLFPAYQVKVMFR